MQKPAVIALFAGVLTLTGFHLPPSQTRVPETIIALERSALDRWGHGDPKGYLELYAPDVTYFDPMQEHRVDGLATMQKMYGPIAGKVKVDSFNMIHPKVQQRGDMAVLTFNLASHAHQPNGEPMTVRWNSTEVYARSGGKWRIVHSHWSFTTPSMNAPPGSP